MFFGTGNGYGVVVDNSDGHKTYMKMGEGGVGFGVALKDFRDVIIFDEQSAYNTFYIIPTYKAADKRGAVQISQ